MDPACIQTLSSCRINLFLCEYGKLDFKYKTQQTSTFTFHFVETVCLVGLLLPQLAPGGHPACDGDPASIGTSDLDPQLVLETRLLFEIRLVLDVLQ